MMHDAGLLFDRGALPLSGPPLVPQRESDLRQVSHELELGRAAEHLACADLLLGGWHAFHTAQGMAYDLAVDVGTRLLRVQVKATLHPRHPQPNLRANPAYFFSIRRAGRGALRVYRHDEFDIFALVALDRRLVAYFAKAELPTQLITLRIPGGRYGPGGKGEREFEGASFARAVAVMDELAAARLITQTAES